MGFVSWVSETQQRKDKLQVILKVHAFSEEFLFTVQCNVDKILYLATLRIPSSLATPYKKVPNVYTLMYPFCDLNIFSQPVSNS